MFSTNIHHLRLLLLLLLLTLSIISVIATIATSSQTHFYSTPSSSSSSILAFAASPQQKPAWRTFLDSIVRPSSSNRNNIFEKTTSSSSSQQQLELLKRELINECRSNFGRNTPAIRAQIESSIDKLTSYYNNNRRHHTPNDKNTATSPLLQRKWIVLWTSEKEINFFLENGISNEIIQVLSDGKTLENYIPFVNIGGGNGGFGVTGRISVDEEGEEEERIDGANEDYYQEGRGSRRTKFKFEKAILNLGRWGTYTFPPVGEGWFDTIYLDKGLDEQEQRERDSKLPPLKDRERARRSLQ